MAAVDNGSDARRRQRNRRSHGFSFSAFRPHGQSDLLEQFVVGSTGPPVPAIPPTGCPQERPLRRGCRCCSRTRWVPRGRDGGRGLSHVISPSVSAQSAPRLVEPSTMPRSRSDPRQRNSQRPSPRGRHGRPDSEATTREWLYCDPDSRTSSRRFSDPLRFGALSMDHSDAAAATMGSRVAASSRYQHRSSSPCRAVGAAC